MVSQGLYHLLLLLAVFFFQDILGQRPAWATVGPDISPEELEEFLNKQATNDYFTIWGLWKASWDIIYFSSMVVVIIGVCLTMGYFISKQKGRKTIKATRMQTSITSNSPADAEYIQNIFIKLESDISKIKKYMKKVARNDKVKHQKFSKKRSKTIEEIYKSRG